MDAFAWPLAATIVGIVAVIALRPALSRLIDRVRKAGRDGFVFDRPQEEKERPPPSFEDLMNHPISSTALDREALIKNQLTTFQLKNDGEKIAVLARALANSQVEVEFKGVSNIIFGSQLNLLVRLAGTIHGLPHEQAEQIFTEAQSSFPNLRGARKYEEWLKYLVTSHLIEQRANDLIITRYGSDFLKYLVDARLAYDRYG